MIFLCFQSLNQLIGFKSINVKSAAIKCLEEIETKMAGVMFYIDENIPFKTVNVKGLPYDS